MQGNSNLKQNANVKFLTKYTSEHERDVDNVGDEYDAGWNYTPLSHAAIEWMRENPHAYLLTRKFPNHCDVIIFSQSDL